MFNQLTIGFCHSLHPPLAKDKDRLSDWAEETDQADWRTRIDPRDLLFPSDPKANVKISPVGG